MDDSSFFPEQELEMEEEIQEEEETPEKASSPALTFTTCFGISQLYPEEVGQTHFLDGGGSGSSIGFCHVLSSSYAALCWCWLCYRLDDWIVCQDG